MFKRSKSQSKQKHQTAPAPKVQTVDISRAIPGYQKPASDDYTSGEDTPTLTEKHEAWLKRDLERLSSAWMAAKLNFGDDHKIENFARATHNLKGMGVSYGYPAISQIAKSLEALITGELLQSEAKLVELHIAACNAAAKEQPSSDHPLDEVAQAVCDTLQQRVEQVSASTPVTS